MSTITGTIDKQFDEAAAERAIDRLTNGVIDSPAIPEMPILTPERIAKALFYFLSRNISIEQAAAYRDMGETTLRELIEKDPFHAKSARIAGSRNGTPILKTSMRLQWIAEDQAAAAAANIVLRPRKRRVGRPRTASNDES